MKVLIELSIRLNRAVSARGSMTGSSTKKDLTHSCVKLTDNNDKNTLPGNSLDPIHKQRTAQQENQQ